MDTTIWTFALSARATVGTYDQADGVLTMSAPIGDIVRGASLVVWAIRDGRDVTQHMHNYLKSKASRERQAA